MNVVTKPPRLFDVDGTLIVNPTDSDLPNSHYVSIKDPIGGPDIRMRVNKAMVRLLKEESYRGAYIVVWSRSGHAWARNVIDILGLKEYVSGEAGVIMDKALVYFDDLPVTEWLKDRVFIGADERYKE